MVVGEPTTNPASPQSACFLTGFQTPNGRALQAASAITDAAKLNYAGFLTSYDLLDIFLHPNLAFTYPDGTTTIPNTPPTPSLAPLL